MHKSILKNPKKILRHTVKERITKPANEKFYILTSKKEQ